MLPAIRLVRLNQSRGRMLVQTTSSMFVATGGCQTLLQAQHWLMRPLVFPFDDCSMKTNLVSLLISRPQPVEVL